MRNRILAAALGFAALIGGLSFASPAQAADPNAACPSGTFCIFTGQNYTGTRWTFTLDMFLDGYNNGIRLSSGINNKGESFVNRMQEGYSIWMFDSGTCASYPWARKMTLGQAATSQGSDWGHRVSSVQLAPAAPLSC